jgi:hypothetical protein
MFTLLDNYFAICVLTAFVYASCHAHCHIPLSYSFFAPEAHLIECQRRVLLLRTHQIVLSMNRESINIAFL